jgi:hypothetical protein
MSEEVMNQYAYAANDVRTTNAPEETSATDGDEAVDDLQALYRQAIHMPEPEREGARPKTPITRMTHNDIQTMRVKTGSEKVVGPSLKVRTAAWIIKTFDKVKNSFKSPALDRRRPACLDAGHQCVHCGKTFSA